MTLLTTMLKDPVPPVDLFDTAPISAPSSGTQLITTLQWNNLIDILQGTSTDEIDIAAIEALGFNFAMITDRAGHIAVSPTTATELAFISGLSSALQTQLDNKAEAATTVFNDQANTYSGEGDQDFAGSSLKNVSLMELNVLPDEPADPPIDKAIIYIKTINMQYVGLYIKLKRADTITEIQII